MISRRDFLKLIGIVPMVLAMPLPTVLPKEPVTPFPVPDFSLPIWCERPDTIWGFPIKYTESAWYPLEDYQDITYITTHD